MMLNCRFAILRLSLIMATGLSWSTSWAADKPSANPSVSRRDPVLVSLRPMVEVEDKVIRLGDIASITGGDAMTRIKLMDLDLEDALSSDQSVTIRTRQIEFRMQLAGIDARRVAIRGDASRVKLAAHAGGAHRTVELTNASTDQRLDKAESRASLETSLDQYEGATLESAMLKAAKDCVMKRLPWPAENVEVRLAQVLPNEVRRATADGYQCTAEMKTLGPATGRVAIRVIAVSAEKAPVDLPLVVEVRHFDDVVLTSKSFERGHVITASDLYVDRGDVTELSDYCSTMNDLIGMTLRRPLRPLSPIRKIDIEGSTDSKSQTAIVVKRKEQVRMVARLGGMVIEASGEAMQDGRIGDTIRLKNVDSNVVLQGKVTGSGEVEIRY